MQFRFDQNKEVADINAVPEQFRAAYKENNGKFALQEPFVQFATAIDGLNKSLEASRTENKGLKGKAVDLSPLQEYGATPEEIAIAVKAKLDEAIASGRADGKGALERYKADLEKANAAKLTAEQQRAERYRTALHRATVMSTVTTALAAEGGEPALLLPVVQTMVRVVEETRTVNGKEELGFRLAVVDERGEERMSIATGQPLTVGELVKELKTQPAYARAFDASTPTGGGSRPSSRVQTGGSDKPKSATAKIAAGIAARKGGR